MLQCSFPVVIGERRKLSGRQSFFFLAGSSSACNNCLDVLYSFFIFIFSLSGLSRLLPPFPTLFRTECVDSLNPQSRCLPKMDHQCLLLLALIGHCILIGTSGHHNYRQAMRHAAHLSRISQGRSLTGEMENPFPCLPHPRCACGTTKSLASTVAEQVTSANQWPHWRDLRIWQADRYTCLG
ncbi:hypothetical protein LZ32DRAFT_265516 [Colletotrichum eremochloae]|nr:hypothetical protein LZ32DRAFT_265516 [Colletotrichum eremochloae]